MNAHATAIRDEFVNALTEFLAHQYRSVPPELRSRLLAARDAAEKTLSAREYWTALHRADGLNPHGF